MEISEILAVGRLVPTRHAYARFLERWKTTPPPNNPVKTMRSMVRKAQQLSVQSDGTREYLLADWVFVLDKHTDLRGDYLAIVTCFRKEEMGCNRNRPKYRHTRSRAKRQAMQSLFAD